MGNKDNDMRNCGAVELWRWRAGELGRWNGNGNGNGERERGTGTGNGNGEWERERGSGL